jgi:hypothetical protein
MAFAGNDDVGVCRAFATSSRSYGSYLSFQTYLCEPFLRAVLVRPAGAARLPAVTAASRLRYGRAHATTTV